MFFDFGRALDMVTHDVFLVRISDLQLEIVSSQYSYIVFNVFM